MAHRRWHRCLIALGGGGALAVGLVAFLMVMGRIFSPPWPKRADVRIEPVRPRLTADAVTPDNGSHRLPDICFPSDEFVPVPEDMTRAP